MLDFGVRVRPRHDCKPSIKLACTLDNLACLKSIGSSHNQPLCCFNSGKPERVIFHAIAIDERQVSLSFKLPNYVGIILDDSAFPSEFFQHRNHSATDSAIADDHCLAWARRGDAF